jgi:hypothetical protein
LVYCLLSQADDFNETVLHDKRLSPTEPSTKSTISQTLCVLLAQCLSAFLRKVCFMDRWKPLPPPPPPTQYKSELSTTVPVANRHDRFLPHLLDRRYNSMWVLVRSTIVFHKSLLHTLFFQFLIFIVCKSFLTSSSHLFFGLPIGLEISGFHLLILVTSLSYGTLFTWSNNFSHLDLINLTIFFSFDQFIQFSLVLILPRSFNSSVGPKILPHPPEFIIH